MPYTWNTAVNTAWATGNIPATSDFNRIENNELYLKQQQEQQATVLISGTVELATLAEVLIGTDTERAVTPEGVKSIFNGDNGNANHTDTITAGGTLIKNIPLDSAYFRQGIATFVDGSTTYTRGVMVFFTTTNTETLVHGTCLDDISSANEQLGGVWTRRVLGKITEGYVSSTFVSGYKATGNQYMSINEVYINGSNLQITYKNNYSADATLSCEVDWRVW